MAESAKEIRVEARMRNNILWHKIHDRYRSVAEFCREEPRLQLHHQSRVGGLLNLKASPRRKDGQWTVFASYLAEIFSMLPEDLFPEGLYRDGVVPVVVLERSFSELPSVHRELALLADPETVEGEFFQEELLRRLDGALASLSPRERKVLELHFGLGDELEAKTLEEIGKDLGVNRERVRQIEARALRKMRHPKRARPVWELLSGGERREREEPHSMRNLPSDKVEPSGSFRWR